MDFNLTREQQDIKKAAREFAVGELTEKVLEWDGNEQFPDGIRLKALELGFAGLTIPESLGGPGFGLFEECLVIEELSAISAGAARAILEPWWGTEFLGSLEKHPLLEGISEGRCQICSLSLSEPFTIDSKPLEGKFHFVLGTADIFFVPAVFKNKDGFLMIPFKTKGVTVKRLTSKLGLRAWPGADLDIKGIDVSDLDFIELNGFNIKAWQVSALRQSAMAIGIARGAVYDSLSYTRKRRIFGQALADFEATKDKFFRAWQGIEMARLMVLRAAGDWDDGKDISLFSAAARQWANSMAQEIADETLQLHGGYGFFEETGAAIRYRDSKMLDILSEPQSITIKRVWANLKNPNIWIR